MKVKIDAEIKSFTVPNFVTVISKPRPRQEGMQPEQAIAIEDLPSDVVVKLCEEFTDAVYTKAGIPREAK